MKVRYRFNYVDVLAIIIIVNKLKFEISLLLHVAVHNANKSKILNKKY